MKLYNYIRGWFYRGGNTGESSPVRPSYTPRTGGSYTVVDSQYRAMSIATVFRCVKLLSESVANLPIEYRKLQDGIYVEDAMSRMSYLLNIQPNEQMSAYDFWCAVVQNMLLEGNAYILPMYSQVTMDIDRLVLCSRGSVTYDAKLGIYRIYDQDNGIKGDYTEDEVIHLKGMSLDGKQGLSVLTFARLTMNITATGDEETLNRFSNGGNVRGIISNDKSVTGFGEYQDKELSKTAVDLDSRFSGGEKIVSLPGQVDFKQISLSSTDMQFLESRKFSVREICRFFGVHPSFVFDDTSNNYKSAEMANVAFLSNTLNPILRKIENELRRKLVSADTAYKYKFMFDRASIYACDLDSRIKYQTQRIAAGLSTVNELRLSENQYPVKGGNKVFISANLKDINEVKGFGDLK